MNLQELEQLIIKEFPEFKPYIYCKTTGYRWLEDHLYIGYKQKDLFFVDIVVKDNRLHYEYCKTLYIIDQSDFPRGTSYSFSKQYPNVDDKEFAIDELKKHADDIKRALEYFSTYDPQEVKDQLKYLGFESLNKQNISFSIIAGTTEILLQLPSSGTCLDYGLLIRPESEGIYQDYSFRDLDETIKFLTE